MAEIKLPYGLKGETLVHISQVKQGLECGCVCADCKMRLIAKKGPVMAPHFAHYEGAECVNALETAIHMAAKQFLTERKEIRLPAVAVNGRPTMEISPARTFKLASVLPETRTGGVVPDILAYWRERPLIIEIYVTHAVDENKLGKIRELNISAIEIDLSGACRDYSPESLSKAVIEETANKKWLFNVKAEFWGRQYLQTTEKRGTSRRETSPRIDYCPIREQDSKVKPYANVLDDCIYCEFFGGAAEDYGYVICGGEHKITTFEQLQAHYRRKDS